MSTAKVSTAKYSKETKLEVAWWVRQQYLKNGFDNAGKFVGKKEFLEICHKQNAAMSGPCPRLVITEFVHDNYFLTEQIKPLGAITNSKLKIIKYEHDARLPSQTAKPPAQQPGPPPPPPPSTAQLSRGRDYMPVAPPSSGMTDTAAALRRAVRMADDRSMSPGRPLAASDLMLMEPAPVSSVEWRRYQEQQQQAMDSIDYAPARPYCNGDMWLGSGYGRAAPLPSQEAYRAYARSTAPMGPPPFQYVSAPSVHPYGQQPMELVNGMHGGAPYYNFQGQYADYERPMQAPIPQFAPVNANAQTRAPVRTVATAANATEKAPVPQLAPVNVNAQARVPATTVATTANTTGQPNGALNSSVTTASSTLRSNASAPIANAATRATPQPPRMPSLGSEPGPSGIIPEIKAEPNSSIPAVVNSQILVFNSKLRDLKASLAEKRSDAGLGMTADSRHVLSELDGQKHLLSLTNPGTFSTRQLGLGLAAASSAALLSAGALTAIPAVAVPQYALLGSFASQNDASDDPRVFQNTNIPMSAFICGLQGSGKSHTMSCMIENHLLQTDTLGVLKAPLSGLVLHYGEYTTQMSFRPCEAAFLAHSPPQDFQIPAASLPKVTVLVSPSNYNNMRALYMQIPGVRVLPFRLRPCDLSTSTIMTLMAVDDARTPLYIAVVRKILRDMAERSTAGSNFNYCLFRQMIRARIHHRGQLDMLEQRLDVLESFLDLSGNKSSPLIDAAPGALTILDLSCPFVDASTACILFDIGLSMYLSTPSAVGKLIAVDEAHKYLSASPSASSASGILTNSLLSIIRQQRHYGARTLISTQEPHVDKRLLDLCSVLVVHRFSSPEWFETLRKHVVVGQDGEVTSKRWGEGLFEEILGLEVGEGIVWAASALVDATTVAAVPATVVLAAAAIAESDGAGKEEGEGGVRLSLDWGSNAVPVAAPSSPPPPLPPLPLPTLAPAPALPVYAGKPLGAGHVRIKVRKRITWDGGKSIMAVN